MEETKIYNTKELRNKLIEDTLKEVKEILEDHKFKYGIDSSPNKGTCFYFKCKIINKNKKE